ncbi:aminotransferase class I/II-fold pyridoxal phosphate-dependent enzyme [Alphaproteobacteria bacterium]|nr:aminotransferase class I/II-fold pyridoxal phosphate-dependent enzyme [Alphaproteobacteria bacterium]
MPGFELIGKEEKQAVMDLFDEGGVLFAHGFQNQRKHYHVREFETLLCKKLQVEHALVVSSGSAAVKIALKTVGVRAGDEVITQAFNFIACVEAIHELGAIPIICNVDKSLNMDTEELERLITSKTKAIMPVHMLGVPADVMSVMTIARKYSIPVVEDNCEALGSMVGQEYAGTVCDIGVLSFDFGKTITSGEGGALLTNSKSYDKFAREYHDHGHECNPDLPRGRDTRTIQGFNYRMSEIQAVIGKVQFSRLEQIIEQSKLRYMCLDKAIQSEDSRRIIDGVSPNYDTFIFYEKNKKIRQRIIALLNDESFGTKNLPDAVDWHSAHRWNHLLNEQVVKHILKSDQTLTSAIAIPILLSRTVGDYQYIAEKISELKYRT